MKNECALLNEIYSRNSNQKIQYVDHLPFVAISEGQNIDLFSLVKALKGQIIDLFMIRVYHKVLNRIDLEYWHTSCKISN